MLRVFGIISIRITSPSSDYDVIFDLGSDFLSYQAIALVVFYVLSSGWYCLTILFKCIVDVFGKPYEKWCFEKELRLFRDLLDELKPGKTLRGIYSTLSGGAYHSGVIQPGKTWRDL